jgi:hypothetical protein
MNELQLLITMVKDLPAMALWVLVGFWAYKVIFVGSVYGVIKLAIAKTHDVMIARKVEFKQMRPILDRMTIDGEVDYLIAQICRIKGKKTGSIYIHNASINWLREAIDEKEAKDLAK